MQLPIARPPAGRGLTARTAASAEAVLQGQRRGFARVLPFIGPAFIAAVAYVDPGNFATNIQSGSLFGYRLLWVVVLANLMAVLFQTLSAKLGIVTGQSLPELCRRHLDRRLVRAMWATSELAAMATDLAEFLGASLGLNLLLRIPLFEATLATALATFAILALERYGFRPLEALIGGLVLVIALCYLAETALSRPALGEIAYHSVVPWLGGRESVYLMVAIVGATVMPHVVYLHSGLTHRRIVPRSVSEARRIFRFAKLDVLLAMTIAGLINMAMLYMAAAVFHHGHASLATIPAAYRTLVPLLGPAAGAVFLVSLLASGLSSSAVGTMAGQLIMQGFVGFTIPIWLRRLVTMAPTVVIVAIGADPTAVLVLSQVVLSLVLPVPLIALTLFTNRRDVMGAMVNDAVTARLTALATAVVIVLNLLLLWQLAGLRLPFLPAS